MSLRLSILNVNTDRSSFGLSWPDDGQKLIAGLEPLRPDWQFRVFQTWDHELPELDSDDAWLISGSVASVRDEAPWMRSLEDRLRKRHSRRQATVGICFGHQMIAKALGGRVGPSPSGWRLGTAETRVTHQAHWMHPPKETLRLFAVHEEQVLQAPADAVLIGGDGLTPVGAMQVGQHMMSTQYHPELTLQFMQSLLEHFADEWTPDLVTKARQEIEQAVDAATFMAWTVAFIEQAQRPGS